MSFFGDIGNFFQSNPGGPDSQAQGYMNQAQGYLGQVPGMLKGAYDPYMQAGTQALPQLQQQYAAMMNPNFINQMGQSFQQSPGYQFQVNQATGAANRAGAAGGYLGTPAEQAALAQTTSGLANQDYYNWLNHAMLGQQFGTEGEAGLYNTGFNAANQYAGQMSQNAQAQAQNANNQANLAYAGQQGQNQTGAGLFGDALGFAGSMFGGPIGGAIGAGIGSFFGGGSGGGGGGMGMWGGA